MRLKNHAKYVWKRKNKRKRDPFEISRFFCFFFNTWLFRPNFLVLDIVFQLRQGTAVIFCHNMYFHNLSDQKGTSNL